MREKLSVETSMSSSIVIWMGVLTVGLCLIILSAAAGNPQVYMLVVAMISFAIAGLGLKEQAAVEAKSGSRSAMSATTARFMGLVWVFGALALFVTYMFILPSWHEWPVFFGAFAFVGALCLLFASAMTRDDAKGSDDQTMLKLGRYLTMAQFAGTIIAIVGLLIDPDKSFTDLAKKDWAAVNVFFFGAIALAALSASALFYTRER
jgi:peptidoglycan/LPS O-acetylase OafA/YrhL